MKSLRKHSSNCCRLKHVARSSLKPKGSSANCLNHNSFLDTLKFSHNLVICCNCKIFTFMLFSKSSHVCHHTFIWKSPGRDRISFLSYLFLSMLDRERPTLPPAKKPLLWFFLVFFGLTQRSHYSPYLISPIFNALASIAHPININLDIDCIANLSAKMRAVIRVMLYWLSAQEVPAGIVLLRLQASHGCFCRCNA